MNINLGCGMSPIEGYVNVDLMPLENVDVVHNLMDFPYPFEDNSADKISAIDVLEHLDNYTDRSSPDKKFHAKPTVILFMEECYRILKDDGELFVQVPSWDSENFKIDPTHVRGFHIRSFEFFDPTTELGQTTGFYSTAKFNVKGKRLANKNLQFWITKL